MEWRVRYSRVSVAFKRSWLNILVILVLVGIAYWSGWRSALDNGGQDMPWWSSFWQNFSTEMMGAIVTFGLIEVFIGSRRNKEATELERKRLQANACTRLLQAETPEKRQPIWAEMRKLDLLEGLTGWLGRPRVDLSKVDLTWANMRGINLAYANLHEARLHGAKLQYSSLEGADLTKSSLGEANLEGANMHKSILEGASIYRANLQNTDLHEANLCGANLERVSLEGANLRDTIFDTNTVLPDAKEIGRDENRYPIYDKHWTTDTDMSRYTNPEHPDFWQPDWVERSKAYM